MFPARHNNQWVGGPSNHQKSYASSFQEQDALFNSYEHLVDAPQPEEALARLRKIASLVKPIMRKRAWKVQVLTEFLPDDERLLGLNINKTSKICIRLRFSHNAGTFLPIESCVDTLLHELSHIVFGPHDANFHALWDELRSEHETLLLRGYTGEGFLTRGQKLGGGRVPPPHEMRRLARASAEQRRVIQNGSGRKIGGKKLLPGADIRKVIADAADRRATIDRGCASGTAQAGKLAEQTGRQTFRTKAEEDDANNRAIAEALFDLLEEEEAQKMRGTFSTPPASGGLVWSLETGLSTAREGTGRDQLPASEEEQIKWALQESLKASMPASSERPLSLSKEREDARDETRVTMVRPPRSPPERIIRRDTPVIDLTGDDECVDDPVPSPTTRTPPESASWACEVCTCINPQQFLACDACGIERPALMARPTASSAASTNLGRSNSTSPAQDREMTREGSLGWNCRECGNWMERCWWMCSTCGWIKDRS